MSEWKRTRQGVRVECVKLLFGWRLIALIDLVTLIPLAIKIVQIQEHEAPYLLALVRQAQANLAPHSRIVWLVVDRAYVDGPSLYELDQMGILFVVIAKTNMAAYTTALALSTHAPLYERIETVRHGHGRDTQREERLTQVKPVTRIRTWSSYRPPKVVGQRLRWQDRPALNAVVVSLWRNQPPSKDGALVYLTNAPVEQPWTILDTYDDRSVAAGFLFELGVTLEWAEVRLLARLGGWAERKDNPPGKIVLTRGLGRLMDVLATGAFLDRYREAHGALPPRIAAWIGEPPRDEL